QPRGTVRPVLAHPHQHLLFHFGAAETREDSAQVSKLGRGDVVAMGEREYRVRPDALVLARILDDGVQRGDRARVASLSQREDRRVTGSDTAIASEID